MHDQAQLYSTLVTLVVLGLIVRRTLRTQTVRVWALIAVPALVLVSACVLLASTPPASPLSALAIAFAAVAGAALGYVRGRHTRVTLGPRPGTLIVQGNVVLVAILVAAFALRYVVRATVTTSGPLGLAASDAVVVFAAASVAVARGMLFFAWRRLTVGNRGIVPEM